MNESLTQKIRNDFDRIMRYIQTAAETAERVVSVCSGSLMLAAAGLLKNRQATTHE